MDWTIILIFPLALGLDQLVGSSLLRAVDISWMSDYTEKYVKVWNWFMSFDIFKQN